MNAATLLIPLVMLLQFEQPADPGFSAKLYAAHEAIAPGGQTELALEIKFDANWHIYHPVLLDTGLPTTLEFAGPPGVTIGQVRFPTPTLGETAGIEYLEHGEPIVCLATLKLADDVEPGRVMRLTAEVSALACIEACIPVSAKAKLMLPVLAEMGASANAELFEKARKALPVPLGEAPYIKGSTIAVSTEKVGIKQSAELVATIKVAAEHHIQDPAPSVEGLIPSRLFIEQRDGITFEDAVWPKPHVREMPGLGKVREQSGEVKVRVPFQIEDSEFPSGPVVLRVLFQYQCCTDAGQCFQPEMAATTVTFVADTPNDPAPVLPAYSASADHWLEADETVAEGGPSTAVAEPEETHSLALVLLFGFLGGLILNVTPCVLPVISIKVISFMQQGGEDPKRVFRLGLTFCAGIMVWFWIFGILSGIGQLPWQYPAVVIGLGSVLFIFAMSLFGVFEIVLPGAAAGKLDELSAREGYLGSFFKGFLATLLGTACTAPFLATALVYAVTQPRLIAFVVFTAAGLGMSSPYLLLAAKPAWTKYIPKPGNWMITFKQAMGFVLLGTGVWLLWILGSQAGADAVVWTAAFWGFLGMAAWMLGKSKPTWGAGARATLWAAALALAAIGGVFSYSMYEPPEKVVQNSGQAADEVLAYVSEQSWDSGIPWAPYSQGVAEELSKRGYTVYVDYTARWCGTCLANKAVALEIDSTRTKIKAMGVIAIKADFTNKDPEMLAELKSFGSPSVPLNLLYPASRPDDVITLPKLLTPSIVAKALDQAGPSKINPYLPAETE